jgi:phosphoribosylformylglycinamidine synthase
MSEVITPEVAAAHGLTADELQRVVAFLGREPNLLELGIFGAMWSEHCSYKSSRKHLRTFPTSGPRVLQGPGENAGVVDVGEGLAVAFKIESHNHPSYLEPYHGAATGVGGIARDVFTMGARPIAAMNALRFGDPTHPRTAYLVEGSTKGMADYGNGLGVPMVAGEVAFDRTYNSNCLVNAFVVGVLPADRIFRGTAGSPGSPVIYVGQKTGRDGIHAAVMASAEFTETTEATKPTTVKGNPQLEKLLMDACLELMQGDAIIGIQDMGAAGLTSSSVEMAGRSGLGLRLELDRVPMQEEGMTPYELMLSETQARMVLVAHDGREAEILSFFETRGLDAAVIGAVTDTGHLSLRWHGEVVAELPIDPLTEGAPVYDRPFHPNPETEVLQGFDPSTLSAPDDLGEVLLQLVGSPTLASKDWIRGHFDTSDAVVRSGGDAAVVRLEEGKDKGIALTVDCPARMVYLDPYMGGMLTVAEACRNVSVAGGEPIGLSDNLNFGNPEKPEIMWQLVEAIRGISDACRALGVPVVSGNVSLYNETEGAGIFPTPTCAVVGLVPDVNAAAAPGWVREGHEIALLGTCTGEVGGSEYLHLVFDRTAGLPPRLDLDEEKAVQAATRELVRKGLVASAHDCGDGGIAVALAESSIAGGLGAKVKIPGDARMDFRLFAEDPSRVVVAYDPAQRDAVRKVAEEAGAPLQVLGSVGGDRLVIEGALDVGVAELEERWKTGLESTLGLTGNLYPGKA